MEQLELGRVKVEIKADYVYIKDLYVKDEANEHGILRVTLVLRALMTPEEALRLEDSEVKVIDDAGGIIFGGIAQKVGLRNEAGYSELEIEAKSQSIKSDRTKKTRTYQDPGKTLGQVASQAFAAYGITVEIKQDIPAEPIIYQNRETDWEFIKRIANQYGQYIFTDSKAETMRVTIGVYPFAKKSLGKEARIKQRKKDIDKYNKIKANVNEDAEPYEFEVKEAISYDLGIGAGCELSHETEQRPLYSKVSEIISRGDGLENQLKLVNQEGCCPTQSQTQSQTNQGDYIVGKVIEVENNQIRVHFDCDEKQEQSKAAWIPYENVMNNYIYAMPDIGNKLFVYYENNGKAIALGSRRSDGGKNVDYATPDGKSLTSTDKLLRFTPGTAELVAGRGANDAGGGDRSMILMSDADGIWIESSQDITISSTNKLVMQAADQQIKALEKYPEYKAKHEAGKGKYLGMGGSLNPEDAQEKLAVSGADVEATFAASAPMSIGKATDLATYITRTMEMAAMSALGGETSKLEQEMLRKPFGSLQIEGADRCRLEVENSEIDIAESINIKTSLFQQMGLVPNVHPQEEEAAEEEGMSGMDVAHLALGILGMFPIIGNVASVVDGVLYMAEGEVGKGVASMALGMVPLGGLAKASKVVGTATKLAKGAATAAKLTKAGKAAMKFQKLAKGMKLTKKIVDKAKYSKEFLKALKGTKIAAWLQRSVKGFKDAKAFKIKSLKRIGENARKAGKRPPKVTKRKIADKEKAISKKRTCKEDPIDIVTGSMTISMTDLYLNDIGSPFVLKRNYESILQNENQPLGSRWILSISGRLERQEDQISIVMADYYKEIFQKEGGVWVNRRGQDAALRLTEEKESYRLRDVREQKVYTYSETGFLTAIEDNCGNRQEIGYNGGKIEKIRLASGAEIAFFYDKNKLARITDMLGRNVTYTYDGDLLTQVRYPNEGTIKYDYTPQGWLRQITDQNGVCYVKNSYDEKGCVIRQETDGGGECVLFYHEQDRTTVLTIVHTGQTTHYQYNRKKLVEKISYDDGTSEEYKYDDKENILWEKDRSGNVTESEYNDNSQITKKKSPDGLEEYWQYDNEGRVVLESDNTGWEKRYSYDKRGVPVEIAERINERSWGKKRYGYDERGRLTEETDENGNTTRYFYKENQTAPWQVETPEGDKYRYEYDKAGRTMAVITEFGRREFAYNHLDYLAMEIDALGGVTKYEYDKLCNPVKEIRPNQYDEKTGTGQGWRRVYSGMDKEILNIDPLGNVIATLRDAEDNIIKEINPNAYDDKTKDGQGIINEYDKENRKIKIRYPDGGVERRKYDISGNLAKKILPEDYDEAKDDGIGYTYEYDTANRLTKITNPQGVIQKTYSYDLKGNIIEETDGAGHIIIHSYNLAGWRTQTRESIETVDGAAKYQVTQYNYDTAGNVTEERRLLDAQDDTTASGRVLSINFTYDKQNRLTEVKDNTGAAVRYAYNSLNQKIYEKRKINDETYQIYRFSYDAAGRLTESTQRIDKEGSGKFTAVMRYDLDKTGNVTKITTPAGYTIERQYDEADRLIAEIHKDKQSGIENRTEFTYDKAGNITAIRDTNGAEERYEYDILNREIKHILKNGGTERNHYDKNGRLIKKILPNEYAAKGETAPGYRYTYDSQGNIITTLAPDGTIAETNLYDKAGRLIQKLDAKQSGVSYHYDKAGRIKSIETSGGAKQAYEYDARGNITAVVDGNKNKTTYNLDRWGRITEIEKADGSKEQYSYDYAGNITETIDGEGNKISYRYNLMNKLQEIIDPEGNKDIFLYDEEGQIKRHLDRNGNEIEYAYNLYGSLTEKWERKTGQRESYEYHKDGNLKTAIAQGMRYGYDYHTDGRLKTKTASGKTLIAYEYDLNGNKIKETDVTGKTTEYNYTILDRLEKIQSEGQEIISFAYNEDGTIKEAASANGMKRNYGYDTDKNLTELEITINGQKLAQNNYAYDQNGNRTEKQQLRGTTYYTYDTINRLTKAKYPDYEETLYYDKAGNRTRRIVSGVEENYSYDTRNRLTHHTKAGIETKYQYDDAGNMLNDGERTYSYDGFNRTTKVETKEGKIQINKYDAEGLRYEIEENSKLVKFIFNENREVIAEQNGDNLKRLIRSFDLWASECTQEKTWYHYASDEQGSIVFVADEEVRNRYEYDAWGNVTECEEQIENRYKYTGQQYDPITQQYYLRARYYNPIIARFTQEDPYRGDGLNLYAYCDNNPVVYYDPSGYVCEHKNPVGKAKSSKPRVEGGRFRDVDDGKGVSEVGHHMPQNSFMIKFLKMKRDDGPSLLMSKADHILTRSFAGKGNGTMKRDFGLTARQRMAKDIRDIRKLFGKKYDKGIKDMLEYAKKLPQFRK